MPSETFTPAEVAPTTRDRLVRSAAYAAGCAFAVLYADAGGAPVPLSCIGLAAPPLTPDDACLARMLRLEPASLFLVNDVALDVPEGDAPCLFGDDVPARFVAAVPVFDPAGMRRGALVLGDMAPHAGLTPAQTYVLHTHAAQLGLQMALADGAAPATVVPDPAAERLRLLESVVVHAKDAILITEAEPIDLPGPRIVYCNAAFTEATGYAEDEVLGRTPRILQSAKTSRAALDRLRAALAAWQPVEVELLNVKKDGTEFWVELSIVPVCDETGWFTHWVSVQRDVTERKLAEEHATRARVAEAENRALAAQLEERKRVEAELIYAASHDDLTKLRNRAFFMDRLRVVLHRIRMRDAAACAVLFLDLDRFKLVNDSLGHRAGDLLLIEVASRLDACIRPEDMLARIGGDEFAILVENLDDLVPALRLADRVVAALKAPFRLDSQDVFSSCSIGIVEVSPRYHSAEDVVRDADIAMYEAKQHRAGAYAVFTGSMHRSAVDALQLQTDLQHAIARGEFLLAYQPIHEPATRRIGSVEALIRWRHPQRGIVPPAAFIGIAESVGAIHPIGEWMRREACAQLRRWEARHPGLDLRLSLNVSAVELTEPRFLPGLHELLRSAGIDPRQLQFEITESVFLREPGRVADLLREIRATGIRIALDDFGTGYSSLGYLDRYAIDAIKIDQSFVGRMLTHPRTMAIVESIFTLGRTLGIDVIAEGVESDAQLNVLRGMGCRAVQGFLWAEPMPAEAIDALLDVLPKQ